MRNKIKELMKKEGGFTLVELLGVIVILGLIVAISIPLIGNVVADSKTKTADAQEELVIDAAQLYYLEKNDATDNVKVSDLILAGYLESSFKGNDSLTKDTTISKKHVAAGKLATTPVKP